MQTSVLNQLQALAFPFKSFYLSSVEDRLTSELGNIRSSLGLYVQNAEQSLDGFDQFYFVWTENISELQTLTGSYGAWFGLVIIIHVEINVINSSVFYWSLVNGVLSWR